MVNDAEASNHCLL